MAANGRVGPGSEGLGGADQPGALQKLEPPWLEIGRRLVKKVAEVGLQGLTRRELSHTELQFETVVMKGQVISNPEVASQQLGGLQRHPGALAPGDGLGMETGEALKVGDIANPIWDYGKGS